MKIGYTVTLKQGDTIISDIPVEASGFNFIERVGEQGKHAQQSLSCSVRGKNVFDLIVSSDDVIYADVYSGQTKVFSGVIKPYLTAKAQYTQLDAISLNILDHTELLRRYVYKDPSLYEFGGPKPDVIIEKVWKKATAGVILRDLFDLCKINLIDVVEIPNLPATQQIINDFRICDGDDMENVISTFCYELCLDYRFEPGKVVIFSTAIEASNVDVGPLHLDLKVQKRNVEKSGVIVKYQTLDSTQGEIYHESNRWDEDWWKSYATKKEGYYYLHDMHDTKPTKKTATWAFNKLEEALGHKIDTVLDVSDVTVISKVEDERGVDIQHFIDSYDADGGCVYIHYNGTFNVLCGKGWGFDYTCSAKVAYKHEKELKRIYGLNPSNVTLKYLDDQRLALTFVENYMKRQKQQGFTFEFNSSKKLELGKFYSLSETNITGLVTVVRINTRRYNPETELYSYKAESAKDVKVSPLVDIPQSNGGGASYPTSKLIQLRATRNVFYVADPAVDITIYATGLLFANGAVPTWKLNGTVIGTGSLTLSLNSADLKPQVNTITCTTTYDGKAYSQDLTLTVIPEGVPGPAGPPGPAGGGIYLGTATQAPSKRPDGNQLLEDDFYLNITNSVNPLPYVFDGGIWRLATINDPNWSQICAATLGDVQAIKGKLDASSDYYKYIQNFASDDAFIAEFGAQHITLNDPGEIKSANYVKGESGLLFSSDGQAEINDLTARGDIFSDRPLDSSGSTARTGVRITKKRTTQDWESQKLYIPAYEGDTTSGYINPVHYMVNGGQGPVARNVTIYNRDCSMSYCFQYSYNAASEELGERLWRYFAWDRFETDNDGNATFYGYDGTRYRPLDEKFKITGYRMDPAVWLPLNNNPNRWKAFDGVSTDKLRALNTAATIGTPGMPLNTIYADNLQVYGDARFDMVKAAVLGGEGLAVVNAEILHLHLGMNPAPPGWNNGNGWIMLPEDMVLVFGSVTERYDEGVWKRFNFGVTFHTPPYVFARDHQGTIATRNLTTSSCEVFVRFIDEKTYITCLGIL